MKVASGSSVKWQKHVLGEVVKLKRGYDLPRDNRVIGKVPIISSSGISGYHNEAKVKGPGVVTGRYGTLGEVFYVNEDFWPLNTALYVQDFKGNDPRFITYLLRSMDFGNKSAAGAVPGLNRNVLHRLKVQIPPIDQQHEIASFLFAFDDLIDNNTRRIKILEEMARRIWREWFVLYRFPGNPDARRPIPSGWIKSTFIDAIDIDPWISIGRNQEVPYVSMGGLSAYGMVVHPTEDRRGSNGSKFQNGDTLLARITPCLENGKTGFVQFLPTDEHAAVGSTEFIVLRSRTLSPEYVYLLARSPEIRDLAIKSMRGASGRQRVDKECFRDYKIVQPDRDILRRFTCLVRPMFSEIYELDHVNAVICTVRDALLPRLLSGKIGVDSS